MEIQIPEELSTSARAKGVGALLRTERPSPALRAARRGCGEHLRAAAVDAGWDSSVDKVGNIVLRIPGRGSLAGGDALILQSHMDMVCEKNPENGP